jgi:hypothetical protein
VALLFFWCFLTFFTPKKIIEHWPACCVKPLPVATFKELPRIENRNQEQNFVVAGLPAALHLIYQKEI